MISKAFARELENLLFPVKLFKLAESEEVESIRWCRGGTAIEINTSVLPIECFMPEVFNIADCKHLFRQLSYYGFQRIRKNFQFSEFQHPHFCSNRFDLVQALRRPSKKRLDASWIPEIRKTLRDAEGVKKTRYKLTESELKSVEPFIETRKSVRLQNMQSKTYSFIEFDSETNSSITKVPKNVDSEYGQRRRRIRKKHIQHANKKSASQKEKRKKCTPKRKMLKNNWNSKKKVLLHTGTSHNQNFLIGIDRINNACMKHDLHSNQPPQAIKYCKTNENIANIENSMNSFNLHHNVLKNSPFIPNEGISHSEFSCQFENFKSLPLDIHTATHHEIDYNSQHAISAEGGNEYDCKLTFIKDHSEDKDNERYKIKNDVISNITSNNSIFNEGKYILNNCYKWEPLNEMDSKIHSRIKQPVMDELTDGIKSFDMYTTANKEYYMDLNNSNMVRNSKSEFYFQNTSDHNVSEYELLNSGKIDKYQEMIDPMSKCSDSTIYGFMNSYSNFPTFIKQGQRELSTEYRTSHPLMITIPPADEQHTVVSNDVHNDSEISFDKLRSTSIESPTISNGKYSNHLNFKKPFRSIMDNHSMSLPVCDIIRDFNFSNISTTSENNLSSVSPKDSSHAFMEQSASSESQSFPYPYFVSTDFSSNTPTANERNYFNLQPNICLDQTSTRKANRNTEFQFTSDNQNSINSATKQNLMNSGLQNMIISKIDNRKQLTDQMSSNLKNDGFLTPLSLNILNEQKMNEISVSEPPVRSDFNNFVEEVNKSLKLNVQQINSDYSNAASQVDQIVYKNSSTPTLSNMEISNKILNNRNYNCYSSANYLTQDTPLMKFTFPPAVKNETEEQSNISSDILPINAFTCNLPIHLLAVEKENEEQSNISSDILPVNAFTCNLPIHVPAVKKENEEQSSISSEILPANAFSSNLSLNNSLFRTNSLDLNLPLETKRKHYSVSNNNKLQVNNKILSSDYIHPRVVPVTSEINDGLQSTIPNFITPATTISSQSSFNVKQVSTTIKKEFCNLAESTCSRNIGKHQNKNSSVFSVLNFIASGKLSENNSCISSHDVKLKRKNGLRNMKRSKNDIAFSRRGCSNIQSTIEDSKCSKIKTKIKEIARNPDQGKTISAAFINSNAANVYLNKSAEISACGTDFDILDSDYSNGVSNSVFPKTKQIIWHLPRSHNYELVRNLYTQLKNKEKTLSDILDSPDPRIRNCAYDVLTFEAEEYLSNTARNPLFQ